MQSRDLFLGLFLIFGAGWIASSTGVAGASIAYLLAIAGCALAGVVYLFSDVLVGREVGGRTLTRLRTRAIAQVFIGTAIAALGIEGFLDAGDLFSAAVAVVGAIVLVISIAFWRGGSLDGEGDIDGSAE
ncbi:hypothetical protein [Halorubrum vacuolatum]|uniref:Uncharacterized protein n=1 Tax=Halorubrum vacuolatum TaxID=63740 RepID=A0A238W2L4_HALVU|nr:hypothetical protein [Halorubrum vacuolatum]SNR40373.1 hypothetical protein SAMN06264855_10531 [Halorubrum vacuolatum]